MLLADEPTTALDVTVQAQILELMAELTRDLRTAVAIVTHDLGVIARLCDRVIVLYGGRIMEQGAFDEIFYDPKHPYTRGPARLDAAAGRERCMANAKTIAGQPRAAMGDFSRLPVRAALHAEDRSLHGAEMPALLGDARRAVARAPAM